MKSIMKTIMKTRMNEMKAMGIAGMSLFVWQGLQAQTAPGIETSLIRVEQGTFDSHQMLMGRKLPPEGTRGDYYLNDQWQEGFITLKSGQTFQKYPLKYDIENDMLEIRAGDEVKILRGERVASFTWKEAVSQQEDRYINSHDYRLEGTPLIGFFQVLVEGKVMLFSRMEAQVKEPTYVQGLDVGKRYSEVVKKEVFYLSDEHKSLRQVSSKKDVWEFVGQQQGQVKQYMKDQKLSVTHKQDLSLIVSFINQLL